MKKIIFTGMLCALAPFITYSMEDDAEKFNRMDTTETDNIDPELDSLITLEQSKKPEKRKISDISKHKKRKKIRLHVDQGAQAGNKEAGWDILPSELKLLIINFLKTKDSIESFKELSKLRIVNREFLDLVSDKIFVEEQLVNFVRNNRKIVELTFLKACESDNVSTVKELRKKGLAGEIIGNFQKTALMIASEHGSTEIVNHLIEEQTSIDSVDTFGLTPLLYACGKNHKNIARILIDAGALMQSTDDAIPLLLATILGNKWDLANLIARGTPVDRADNRGRTALMLAAASGDLEMVQLLINNDAMVNAKDMYGLSPLYFAARFDHKNVVELLLSYGADPSIKDRSDETALMCAAFYGHLEIVKLLINYAVDVNQKTQDGVTALTLAAEQGHATLVAFLVDHGAVLSVTKSGSIPALTSAVKNGHISVVNLLVQRGIGIDGTDKKGLTLLMHAAKHGHEQLYNLLIKYGADTNARDKKNRTALDYKAKQTRSKVTSVSDLNSTELAFANLFAIALASNPSQGYYTDHPINEHSLVGVTLTLPE